MDLGTFESTLAALEAEAMNDVADYVARGRRLQHVGDEELAARYLSSAEAWAASPMDRAVAGDVVDAASEFTLRGVVPPYDAARGHIEIAVAAIVREVGTIDPEEMVDPGLVSITQWRPDAIEVGAIKPIDDYGAVARKP